MRKFMGFRHFQRVPFKRMAIYPRPGRDARKFRTENYVYGC